jgi:ATP-binding cassette subfamily B protein/ATP-binding cassette subfamily C protein
MKIPIKEYWHLLRTYLRPQRRRVAMLALLVGAKIVLRLLNPQIMRAFLDQAFAGAPLSTLVSEGAAFFVIAALTQGLTVANLYMSEMVAWSATNALRLDLLRHCLHLDMTFHKAHKPGELTERIDSDVDALSNFFSRFVLNVIGNGVLAVGILVLLFRESWLLGVSATLYTIIGLLVLVRLRELTIPFWDRLHDIRAQFYGFLGEQFSGTEDIRANGAQAYVMRRFYLMLQRWLPINRNASLAAYSGWMTNAALVATGEALSYGLAGYLWFRGSISIGVAYLITDYMGLLFGQIAELRWQLSDLQHAEAAIGRIRTLFDQGSALSDGTDGPLPAGALAVTFQNVSFAYKDTLPSDAVAAVTPEAERSPSAPPEEREGTDAVLPSDNDHVLHDIDFALSPGRILGLLGRTGSGKTTLARLLMRLYDPTKGQVCLGGLPLTATTLHDVRRRVALVTQEVQLFRASVRDNLTFFNPSIADADILAVLQQLGLDTWLASLPDGLDTALSAGGGGLSAGQAQLLAFARVFLFNPSLVILDEASSRLDPATELQIERAVDLLLEGRTGVIIAHRLNTVQRADEVLILEDGHIREHGARAALAADPTSYFHHLLQTGMAEVLA